MTGKEEEISNNGSAKSVEQKTEEQIIQEKKLSARTALDLKLSSLPTNPGVYQFKDKTGKIIYVGKAKNLRNRVRSYFVSKPVGPLTTKMISLIRDVEIINTDSEVESLILEMNIIKRLKPRYNVNLKDDKSYPYIVITKEAFPRVFPTRKRRNDGSKYFGPYTDVGSVKFSLKMLRDIFMIRTCNLSITQEAIDKKKFKVCLEYHIHKCEGPCEGLVSQVKYNEMIYEIEKVLNGKTDTLIKELKQKMLDAATHERYEEAALIRNRLDSLEVYSERQKVVSEDLLDKDIISFVKEEDDACALIMNIRDGKVIGKRHFYMDAVQDKEPEEILESVIYKYYTENTFIPDEIHLPEEVNDVEALKGWFIKQFNKKVDFKIPKRGEKVQLLNMVKTNARFMLDELKLQRLKREFIPNSVTALKRDLRLTKLPRRIECFDISNIQGTDTVASMVVFEDGRPKKSDYRKFKIQSSLNEVGRPDDFASMREVIYRRFRKVAEKNLITSPPAPLLKGEGSEGAEISGVIPPLSPGERGTGGEGEVVKTIAPYPTEKARALRKRETPSEKKLWNALRNRKAIDVKFRRQHPLGYYIVDFYSDEYKLIIEIDGSIHDLEDNAEYDKNRQTELENVGYRFLRFKNDEVMNDLENVLDVIRAFITSPPSPLLKGEGSEGAEIPSVAGGPELDTSFSKIPDLIVIDGGKGQLSSAVQVLKDLGITGQNIIGLAKRLEEVFVPETSEAQSIPKTSSGLKLLQRVRDEAHRFAITFHRSLRDKRTLKSELEDIKGIGKATVQKLLTEFGSVEKIKEMITNDFPGFEKRAGKKAAERLKEFFSQANNITE